MDTRQLTRLPVPPGEDGVSVVVGAWLRLLQGGPAFAAMPAGAVSGAAPAAAATAGAVPTTASATVPGVGRYCRFPDTGVVLGTSGTTGRPMAVELSTAAVVASAQLGARAIGEPGLWLTAVPVTGIGGLLTVVRSLAAGVEPVAWPGVGGAGSFTADGFAAAAGVALSAAERAGLPCYVSLVPTQVLRLARSDALDALARFEHVLVGGAALSPGLRARLRDAGVAHTATYGATETAGGVVYDGVPLPGVAVELMGGADAAGPGAGSIRICGPTVAAGYHWAGSAGDGAGVDSGGAAGVGSGGAAGVDSGGAAGVGSAGDRAGVGSAGDGAGVDSAGDRAGFDSAGDGEGSGGGAGVGSGGGAASLGHGCFDTGDTGHWREGVLEVLGRADATIKVGGAKVSLAAVAAVITGLPDVLDALVVAAPDEEWGQVPAAVVVPAPGGDPADLAARIRARVRDALGGLAVPRAVELNDTLPMTAAGKPDPSTRVVG